MIWKGPLILVLSVGLASGCATGSAARSTRAELERAQQELRGHVTLVESAWRVAESNDVAWIFAWAVTLHNDLPQPLPLVVTIQFIDEDGFVVDRASSEPLFVQANADRTVVGRTSIIPGGASHVVRASASVSPVER